MLFASQSLFQQKVLCNEYGYNTNGELVLVTILILVEGSLQFKRSFKSQQIKNVTILILVEGSLQYVRKNIYKKGFYKSQSLFQQKVLCNMLRLHPRRHNRNVTILILVEGSLQFIKKSFKIKQNGKSQSLFQQKVLCNAILILGSMVA